MSAEIDPFAPRSAEHFRTTIPVWAGALYGTVCTAVTISTGAAMAAVLSTTSPIDAIGRSFIDRTPAWLKNLAISLFAEHDKTALRVGIFIVLTAISIVVGITSRHRSVPLVSSLLAASALGVLALLERPGSPVAGIAALLVGTACGLISMIPMSFVSHRMWHRIRIPSESQVPLGWDRRRFVITATALAGMAALIGSWGIHRNRERVRLVADRRPPDLPNVEPSRRHSPTPAQVHPDVSYITPTKDFYRIDTALSFPTVDLDTWSLRIHGLVERNIEIDYDDLRNMQQTERTITLCCVSNEVGGPYIGNAIWQGVLLADVLDLAGVLPDAEQVFSTSLDGWTCGFPVRSALDGRDAMIALGMNGESLPLRNGFPARLVVPGLYGYVSATKWLSEIEINRWSDARGYWVPRGWSRLAPVKTQSRIDVPRRQSDIDAGLFRIAGVAWAQHTGIERVEVRIDRGPWLEATLSDDVTDDAWRMWTCEWEATPGRHSIQVRATDKSGVTQPEEVSSVAPDGATGWHTRTVTVREGSP